MAPYLLRKPAAAARSGLLTWVCRDDDPGVGRLRKQVGEAGHRHRAGPAVQHDDRAARAALIGGERHIAGRRGDREGKRNAHGGTVYLHTYISKWC